VERPGVTKWIVEVGPATVRGPCDADQDVMSTALRCIDDEIALLDGQPVAVASIWRAVFRSVLSDCAGTAVLVCPTWWSSARVELVREAASSVVTEVDVLQRAKVVGDGEPGMPTVVEIAPDFVVVWRTGGVVAAEPRLGGCADIARAVADRIGDATDVLVDAPVGVDGAVALASAVCQCCRADGLAVTAVHKDRVLVGVRDEPMPWVREASFARRRRPAVAGLAALVVSGCLFCIGVASPDGSPTTALPMTLLVEGHVAVKVPAPWVVRRITAGPGSARVEVAAPDDAAAVLITQSQVRSGEQLAETAVTLRRALDDQRAGVFSRFNPDDRRADRPAATYREDRDGRGIDWTVFVDDSVRIAIGCQSTIGREQVTREVCDEAIRSAHSVM
jgi:type VII secretion-associated protein (TIGR03931 family)